MVHAVDPPIAAYCPTLHASHAVTFDAAENLPCAHSMHVLAPELAPVLVIDPALHTAHFESTAELTEYWPAAHGVQLVAPAAEPRPVIDPATQPEQYDWPVPDTNLPASHNVHVAAFGDSEYFPIGQPAHRSSPTLVPFDVSYVPGKHATFGKQNALLLAVV